MEKHTINKQTHKVESHWPEESVTSRALTQVVRETTEGTETEEGSALLCEEVKFLRIACDYKDRQIDQLLVDMTKLSAKVIALQEQLLQVSILRKP